jgi:hypothetical protein
MNVKIPVDKIRIHCIFRPTANGGVLVSTECLMRWLHVEVDRLASLKAAQNK